jgi:predicted lysophospholipase L1 biosynthesis ABC-type transport system permease subunit
VTSSGHGPQWWATKIDSTGAIGGIRRQWPWLSVCALVLIGLAIIAIGSWRLGAVLIGLGMLLAGVLRSVMHDPGILAIRRHRAIDISFFFFLGVATIVFAAIVPSGM